MNWAKLIRLFEREAVDDQWKVYQCSKKGFGASLIQNQTTKVFYVITGSDSEYKPLPAKRIQRTRDSFRTYRGRNIDVVVFIGKIFSDEARRKVENGVIERVVLLQRGRGARPFKIIAPPPLAKDSLILKLQDFMRKTQSPYRKQTFRPSLPISLDSDSELVKNQYSKRKPKILPLKKPQSHIQILAFSDWRVQRIRDIFDFISGIDPVDFVLYGGDDIGRFEEENLNLFSDLATYTKSGQVLAVIGNDDYYSHKGILRSRGIHDLYERSLTYGNFAFIGLESVTRGPAIFRHDESDFEKHLKRQINEVEYKRVVVLSHAPPYGVLDRGIRFAQLDKDETHHIGSTSLRHFIETEGVDLVVCGHCHSQGGMVERFRNTVIANVSSHDAPNSKGNIAIIELTEEGAVSVEWHDTGEILGKNSLMQVHGIGPARAERLTRSGIIDLNRLSKISNLARTAVKTGLSQDYLKMLRLKAKALLENRIYPIKPFSAGNEKVIFFDIETDLACKRVWLIGLQKDGRFIQLYADDWTKEKEVLLRFLEILRDSPGYGLISFSTTNFDYRVTLRAAARHKLDARPLISCDHKDLGILIKHSFIFPLKTYALKDLGSFLGYAFKYPDMDGLLVALKYHKHVEEKEALDPKILEYNEDDVKVMPYLIDKLAGPRACTS